MKTLNIQDYNGIADWITDAAPGAPACYYIGRLVYDRESNRSINPSARYVWAMMEAGYVFLKQKRGELITKVDHEYHYIMERSSKGKK